MNPDRFLEKFTMGDACWEWTAGKSKPGYGRFGVDGNNRLAHRVSYEFFVGPIPEDKVLDHTCRNKGCVRPGHLEPVDFVENVRRGDAWKPEVLLAFQKAGAAATAAKPNCRSGHPLSGDNLKVRPSDGARICLTCSREAGRRYHAKKRSLSSI